MAGKALERAARESHIMMIFISDHKLGKVDELTAVQVARALMLEPSWHVRKLLASLVAQGKLTMRGQSDKRCDNLSETAGQKYWYKLSDETRKEVDSTSRDVPINVNGVLAGQLRMF